MKRLIFLFVFGIMGFIFISCTNTNKPKYYVYKIHYTGMQYHKMHLPGDNIFGTQYYKKDSELEMTDLGIYEDSLKLMNEINSAIKFYEKMQKKWLDEYFKLDDFFDTEEQAKLALPSKQAALQTYIGASEYYIVLDERYIKDNYEEIINKIIQNKDISNESSQYIKIYTIYDGTDINMELIKNEL